MSNHKHFGEGTIGKWHHPEISLENLGLREGMTFMDIGCGYGFFTILAAQIVNESGKVYAVDIDSSSINQLKHDALKKGLKNIHTEVGAAEGTIFCRECADIVFYNTVLHDFRDPTKVLRNAKTMLKPNGKMVNIDWKKKPTAFGPSLQIRLSEEQTVNLIKQAGFTIASVKDVESDFYIVTAKPQDIGKTPFKR
jgi:ubiquinone/menaquinone biosynthesis C-methylase UbiE